MYSDAPLTAKHLQHFRGEILALRSEIRDLRDSLPNMEFLKAFLNIEESKNAVVPPAPPAPPPMPGLSKPPAPQEYVFGMQNSDIPAEMQSGRTMRQVLDEWEESRGKVRHLFEFRKLRKACMEEFFDLNRTLGAQKRSAMINAIRKLRQKYDIHGADLLDSFRNAYQNYRSQRTKDLARKRQAGQAELHADQRPARPKKRSKEAPVGAAPAAIAAEKQRPWHSDYLGPRPGPLDVPTLALDDDDGVFVGHPNGPFVMSSLSPGGVRPSAPTTPPPQPMSDLFPITPRTILVPPHEG